MHFVSSRLDAGNSILYSIAQGQLQRIQRTQNTASKTITNTRRYEHITPVLRQLHWFPIQERIEFMVLCLTYKALHNMAPLYLTQFLSQNIAEVKRQLSNDTHYRPLLYDSTIRHNENTQDAVNRLVTKGSITQKVADYLVFSKPRTPSLYILPKMHKPARPPLGRPIISANQ